MTKNKMMSKEDAEDFLSKVDMEGLDYAATNYALTDTGDEHFDMLIKSFNEAITAMQEYIEKLREHYDIDEN